MSNEFQKYSKGNETRYVLESASGGGTSAGAGATLSRPVGEVQSRNMSKKPENATAKPRNHVALNAAGRSGGGAHKNRKRELKIPWTGSIITRTLMILYLLCGSIATHCSASRFVLNNRYGVSSMNGLAYKLFLPNRA